MKPLQVFYSIFYGGGFSLALYIGLITGFTGNSHTPPGPFIIEFFVLPIGLVLLLIDLARNKPNTFKKLLVHVIGLCANWAIMAYILILYFG
jgi:hypothetical protein